MLNSSVIKRMNKQPYHRRQYWATCVKQFMLREKLKTESSGNLTAIPTVPIQAASIEPKKQ